MADSERVTELDKTPNKEVVESSESEEIEDSVNEDSQVGEDSEEAKKDPTDLGEDITADDLGIDLDSLRLSTPNILGKAKPQPSLASSQDKRSVGRPPKEDEGLFAWCEQFSYTPGVDYLKLHRLYPKTWEGLSIGGFIEEVYEPIDEHWLISRWGGGSYQIEAYQRDSTGRSRKVQVKHAEISGLPKAFMGSDDMPHPLPASRVSSSISSRRSSDVLRRRMGLGKFRNRSNEFDEYEGDDVESISRSRPRLNNVDKPLADASAIYKVMQETKKSENDALGVLREAQKDVHTQMQVTAQQQADMYKTLLDQQKEEMHRVREESRQSAESSSAPFKEMLKFMSMQGNDSSTRSNLDALRQAHDTAIQSLTREHSTHIDDLRRSFEQRQSELMDELNRARTSYTQEVERVRQDYLSKEQSSKDDAFRNFQTQLQMVQNQSAESRERHRDELALITREKNETISQLRQDLTEIRTQMMSKDHESRMSLLERENLIKQDYQARERSLQDRITTLESSSSRSLLEERQRLKEEFEDKYEAKMTATQQSFETRLESMRESSELKVDSANKEAKSLIEVAKKELHARYESQIARLEATIDSLKNEHQVKEQLSLERSKLEQQSAQKERENQRLILESTAQSREALAEMSRKQLESKVRELTKDLEYIKKERDSIAGQVVSESSDPFEQLEKLEAIKGRLKKYGFIDSKDEEEDSEEPKEENPKDFLGKIMRYGPQIVGPILQRVDAATAVAQQAVAQQQAQETLKSKEQMIEQQRLIAQEQEAAVHREMALRERREMLLQRRIEREQENEMLAQRQEMAQHLETVRAGAEENPQVEDVREVDFTPQDAVVEDYSETPIYEEQEVTEMSDTEGYGKLADYLAESVAKKKSASVVINEIRMAKMMGMFSQDMLTSVLSREFDELITELSSLQPSLRSPKARITLKSIMEGLKK
jgi:hypothetical protein